jgi:cell division septum initiation protein DivIVA
MADNKNSEHPLWNTLTQFLQLEAAPSLHEPAIAGNDQFSLARDKVFAIAHVIRSLMESTPATLVSVHALNQLNKHLQAALNELNAYVSNKNTAHISNALTQFEQNVLPWLWGFVPITRAADNEALPAIIEGLSQSASETIKQLVQERDKLVSHIQETDATAAELKSRLDAMSESAARERAEASAAVAKLEQAFAAKETERAAAFDAAINKIKADYSTLEKTTKNESALLISGLEEQKNNAAKIVQVVGNIGVTGNYQGIAKAEAKQANFWRWATVLFFAGGVTLAGATFYRFWGEPITPESIWAIAVRLLYAIAITAPAWYTARESARHRTNSDRARQTELELASLGPFIELLPPEKKISIREEMTKHYFGREVELHTAKAPLDAQTVKEIAIELAKAFKK